MKAANTTKARVSDFMISLKFPVVNLITRGCLWNLANFRNLSLDVGNGNEPTGRAERDENASKADVGGGFAIDKLVYRRELTDV